MLLKQFDPNSTDWLKLIQHGRGSLPFYTGRRFQRGGGFGNVLRHIIRMIPKFINSPVGNAVSNAATGAVNDISEGRPVAEAFKTRGRTAVKELTGLGKHKIQKRKIAGFVRLKPKATNRRSFIPVS